MAGAREWSERARLLVTVATVAVVNLAAWGIVYKLHRDFKVLEKQRVELTKKVNALEDKAETKPDKDRELERLTRENTRQLKKIPDDRQWVKFMQELADLAVKTSVKIDGSIRPRLDQTPTIPGLGQNFKRDVYQASYQADFKGFCEFANFLEEHHQRFVQIENLSITAAGGGMSITGATHKIVFDVVTYRFVQ